MLNNLILFIAFIFIVYDPWFFQTLRGFILGSIITLTFLFIRKANAINIRNLKLLLVIAIFLIVSLIPAIVHYTFDFSVFLMYLRMLLYSILLYFLYLAIPQKSSFILYLKKSIYFQFLVVILCVLAPGAFQDFIFSVHTVEDYFYDSEQGYRLYIFTSMAFFQLSLFFGFVFNFFLNLYLEKKVNLTPLLLCFVCGMISGRSFLLFAAISIFISGFNLKLIIASLIAAISIYFIAVNFQDNIYIYHALEPIINYINDKGLQSSSSDNLINNMLIFPSDKQILVGDGIYTNDDKSYYMHTDSGYLRQIFYGGILYLSLCLTLTIYIVKRVSANWFQSKKLKFFISSMLIFSIGHVKADVFMYPGITFFLLLLLSFYPKDEK
ncbi:MULTISPECIES: hypothetical protein [Providencia]|uniref:hypothetical protein n=1 Tax=Providencia TaxID=586 RepID=UPI0012B544D0|nr:MULTISPECIES: hypothetical protein [Providencia]EMF0918946.1 hypothetical protein [Providencia stuartii]MTC20405.1 hypothetical protein [Providencia stuartii]